MRDLSRVAVVAFSAYLVALGWEICPVLFVLLVLLSIVLEVID